MSDKELVTTKQNDVAAGRQLPIITPAVDVYENENEILLHADMPGVSKDSIDINIDNGRLSISGTRSIKNNGAMKWYEFGDAEFNRSFSVPQTIDVGKVSAHLEEGVLQLHLPKSEAAKPKQIQITTA